ncbi:MAG: ACP S-malonyltransferase [Polyangiaceae bacterium]|nr:ACP S-malonyltransferase [Polyangiaceae bacterium]MCW5791880.1 ACP S-malonyltransferase [Polyangiaceae bacterium]
MTWAWLFPGQGTQSVGMGQALAQESAAAREVFERADAALGFSISRLCFEGPESELVRTEITQPAIVTVSLAVLSALKERAPELAPPAYAAGHSLGEYSALVAAGALSLEQAVRLVHLRGKAMQSAVPEGRGAMAAVMGGDPSQVEALCAEAGEVSPANFNAPGQIVIAGTREGVARAAELASARKLKLIPLKVSAPFHCSLMEPAARQVEAALGELELSPLTFPVVSNVEAAPNADMGRIPDLLVRQVDGPVRWEQSVRWLSEQGVTQALELGPGKVLAGLVRKTAPGLKVCSVSDPSGLQAALEALQAG